MELVITAVVGVRNGLREYEVANTAHIWHHSDAACPLLSATFCRVTLKVVINYNLWKGLIPIGLLEQTPFPPLAVGPQVLTDIYNLLSLPFILFIPFILSQQFG